MTSAAFFAAMRRCGIALMQEPWNFKWEFKGLRGVGGELVYVDPFNDLGPVFNSINALRYCLCFITVPRITRQ
jgi:hypothetical protein